MILHRLEPETTAVDAADFRQVTVGNSWIPADSGCDASASRTVILMENCVLEAAAPQVAVSNDRTSPSPVHSESEVTASLAEMGVNIMTREEMRRQLLVLERKYDVSSGEFYSLWLAGQSPVEGIDRLRWTVLYEAWREQSHHD